MAGITTRIATLDDETVVSTLLMTSYSALLAADYTPEVLAVALPLMGKANPVLLRSGTYYVAENTTRKVVACGGWTAERPGEGGVEPGLGHIRHFATHPDWTRRGAARALIEVCFAAARDQDITRMECYSSLSAVPFYAAMGFRARGPIDIALSENTPFPSVLMDHIF